MSARSTAIADRDTVIRRRTTTEVRRFCDSPHSGGAELRGTLFAVAQRSVTEANRPKSERLHTDLMLMIVVAFQLA